MPETPQVRNARQLSAREAARRRKAAAQRRLLVRRTGAITKRREWPMMGDGPGQCKDGSRHRTPLCLGVSLGLDLLQGERGEAKSKIKNQTKKKRGRSEACAAARETLAPPDASGARFLLAAGRVSPVALARIPWS